MFSPSLQVSDEAKDIIKQCLTRDPRARYDSLSVCVGVVFVSVDALFSRMYALSNAWVISNICCPHFFKCIFILHLSISYRRPDVVTVCQHAYMNK